MRGSYGWGRGEERGNVVMANAGRQSRRNKWWGSKGKFGKDRRESERKLGRGGEVGYVRVGKLGEMKGN